MKKQEPINQEKIMDSLLESLLDIANSNNKLVASQIKDLLESCFEKDTHSGNYKPIMVPFEMSRPVIDNSSNPPATTYVKTIVEVPKITLQPISILAINNSDLSSKVENQSVNKLIGHKKQIEKEFDVDIHCTQQNLPAGLAMLINILTQSISPV